VVNMKKKVGRGLAFKSVEELNSKLENYKEYLTKTGKPPTMAGLAYYLGIDRRTLYNYAEKAEFFHTIKNFRDWIMMTLEESAIEKGNGGIVFLLKNYGYTDQQNVDVTGGVDLHIKWVSDGNTTK